MASNKTIEIVVAVEGVVRFDTTVEVPTDDEKTKIALKVGEDLIDLADNLPFDSEKGNGAFDLVVGKATIKVDIRDSEED